MHHFGFDSTKWCGAGNIAKNYDDLGTHNGTDMCCRAHDNCDDYMDGKATKYNLTNESRFTKLHCKCDDEFYDCLKKANTSISHTVGNLYFNVLKRTCYKLEHPEKCSQYRTSDISLVLFILNISVIFIFMKVKNTQTNKAIKGLFSAYMAHLNRKGLQSNFSKDPSHTNFFR
ncbi:UNVERIFIED_CONTAM: Phospholipase A2 [Trichonephila clavipes]